MARVLLAGESWVNMALDIKGIDVFPHAQVEIGCKRLLEVLAEAGHEVTHLQSHDVARDFPLTMAELDEFDVLILSDVGANTLLLHPDTFNAGVTLPNRMHLIRDWVASGRGLMMAGGYLSFQGFQAKAGYFGTTIADVLPVELLPYDDRVEAPQGVSAQVVDGEHPITAPLASMEIPPVLGYQRLAAKSDSSVLMSIEGTPFLTVGEYGEGRTVGYATDVSPHWAPVGFLEWEGYPALMVGMVEWLSGAR